MGFSYSWRLTSISRRNPLEGAPALGLGRFGTRSLWLSELAESPSTTWSPNRMAPIELRGGARTWRNRSPSCVGIARPGASDPGSLLRMPDIGAVWARIEAHEGEEFGSAAAMRSHIRSKPVRSYAIGPAIPSRVRTSPRPSVKSRSAASSRPM